MDKQCTTCERSFVVEPDDASFYKKIDVLEPTICPTCRMQLRLSFRNERSFYKRECDKCKKQVISMYSLNKPYTVWCYDCWFSDNWDGREYALDYDDSKSFLEQLETLFMIVPKIGLLHLRSVNSEYINISADNKNCYMIVESSNNEDCTNCYWIQQSKDLVDCSFTSKVERSYECDDCYDSYGLLYSKGCHSCTDSYFLFDCRGCMDCFGCMNLRQKQYCLFNEQYSKTEYLEKIAAMKLDTHAGVERARKAFETFKKTQPRKYAELTQTVEATGNYIMNAKNIHHCFHTYDAEDCRYCVHAWRNSKDNVDSDTIGRNAETNYQCVNVGQEASNNIVCVQCWGSNFLQYSYLMFGSDDCFGCFGLRNKKYCILNKEYSEPDYHVLKSHIIEEMKTRGEYGAFFPAHFSNFGYNEACVQEQFPLTKDEALAKGFKWEDTPRGTFGKETVSLESIPESIHDVPDGFIQEILACEYCSKNYRLIPNELGFYKKVSIPVPHLCPECRHTRRFVARGPNLLFDRSCMCERDTHGHTGLCSQPFKTNYAPGTPEVLYCEDCYQKEVV